MLGKLFNLSPGAPGGSASRQTQAVKPLPESIQEDVHTRSLLFPDSLALSHRQDQVFPLPSISTLHPGSSDNTFDYDGDIDLEVRDVRVIVMQDSLGSVTPSLLFDSHPGPTTIPTNDRPPVSATTPQALLQDLRRVPTSPRKQNQSQSSSKTAVAQPDSPQPRQGAFDRRPSLQSRPYSTIETDTQRAAREYREELASFSNCIFANTEVMSYKGTSTKVHIIPSDSRVPDTANSVAADGRGSMGRSSARSSRLAQSFTSETAGAMPFRQFDRKKVLITRLFPVNLPNDDAESPSSAAIAQGQFFEESTGFPFPFSPADEAKAKKKKQQPKQKRTPMYAVALVLQLPTVSSNSSSAAPKSMFRGSGSLTEQDAFPSSSYNSARLSGWTMVGGGFGSESLDSSYSNDVEDRMDAITQHWDIIMRTLTHLQSVVATALFPMLKQADMAAPDPTSALISAQVTHSSSNHSRRGSDSSQIKPPKTNAKLVALGANCLMQDQRISQEVDHARVRVVSGLRATRVVTGQGRWGPWREEARWIARWAGDKENGFFFYRLLTGFLATHTDWLQALSPQWYRRRYHQQQKTKGEEDASLPCRTIIVTQDKMAARRLIFLLSAFLPANQQVPSIRSHRPATSASFGAFGHSPPSFIVPIVREESLRRRINRRPGPQASHSRSFSVQSHNTAKSITGIPAPLAHLSMDAPYQRRASDAMYYRPGNLPIAGSDIQTRKSSAATTHTITPDAAIPHFSTMHRSQPRHSHRPGSSGSVAADDLKRSLKRDSSAGHGSLASTDSRGQSSRWGSVITGLWGAKRRDSATVSSRTPNSEHFASPLSSPTKSTSTRRNKLSQMVSDTEPLGNQTRDFLHNDSHNQIAGTNAHLGISRGSEDVERNEQSDVQLRTPDPSGAFESPVKTSINDDDGVIDVDVQFPEFITSFETAISSPSSSGYLSTPGLAPTLDSFEQISRVAVDGDVPLNVAGWLQRFHPDFTLQAIPPQKDLLEHVREALVAEPTPQLHHLATPAEWPVERWVDVSTAIVADTTNFTIKRLRYRRLVKPRPASDRSNGHLLSPSSHPYSSSSLMTPALSPYEQPLRDKIDVEDLVTLDETIIGAVERVIALGGREMKAGESSANSSRSASKRRERSDSEVSEPEQPGQMTTPSLHTTFPEVPRGECKTVVLSALEGIVHEVAELRERESQGAAGKASSVPSRQGEGILRLAVRAWLDNVEHGEI